MTRPAVAGRRTPMKITGFQITYRLRELQDAREVASGQFGDSLFQFPAEVGTKPSPEEVTRLLEEYERKIAVLQVAQARYNLAVQVEVQGRSLTLHEAVKLVGGAARLAKMWKDAAKKTGTNPYSYGEMSRDKDHEYTQRTVSVQECLEYSTRANRWASALRQAIQLGNVVEMEIEGLDPGLFE
jgi:hypothetical protein